VGRAFVRQIYTVLAIKRLEKRTTIEEVF